MKDYNDLHVKHLKNHEQYLAEMERTTGQLKGFKAGNIYIFRRYEALQYGDYGVKAITPKLPQCTCSACGSNDGGTNSGPKRNSKFVRYVHFNNASSEETVNTELLNKHDSYRSDLLIFRTRIHDITKQLVTLFFEAMYEKKIYGDLSKEAARKVFDSHQKTFEAADPLLPNQTISTRQRVKATYMTHSKNGEECHHQSHQDSIYYDAKKEEANTIPGGAQCVIILSFATRRGGGTPTVGHWYGHVLSDDYKKGNGKQHRTEAASMSHSVKFENVNRHANVLAVGTNAELMHEYGGLDITKLDGVMDR